jgi:hypothetical protein
MAQRVHVEHVDLPASLHAPRNESRARAVIYRHPGTPHATPLATIVEVPAQREPGAPNQPAAPPARAIRT